MTATRGRNAVLLMIAPWRRRVVVLADEGITRKVEPALWAAVVERVTAAFKDHRYTEGLVAAVHTLGAALTPHFPPVAGDTNELPDTIDRGR
jgi:putative membrane protein